MSRRYDKEGSKRRILSVCVKLFIEKGFKKTTNAEILELADVTSSTFYNIFKTKDGVLLELTEFMFENQFSIAEKLVGEGTSPIMVYAAETALQLTLTELNENLREIYVDAYSQPHIAEYIYQNLQMSSIRFLVRICQTARSVIFMSLKLGLQESCEAICQDRAINISPLKRSLNALSE